MKFLAKTLRGRKSPDSGFVLIEVLAAASIMALGAAVLTMLILSNISRQRDEQHRLMVLYQLEALVSEINLVGTKDLDLVVPVDARFNVHKTTLDVPNLPNGLVTVSLAVALDGVTARTTFLTFAEGIVDDG
jgi:Tfp pilus assembly protein PilV